MLFLCPVVRIGSSLAAFAFFLCCCIGCCCCSAPDVCLDPAVEFSSVQISEALKAKRVLCMCCVIMHKNVSRR